LEYTRIWYLEAGRQIPVEIGDRIMGTALLAWELGGGLGHLVNLLPLARGLRRQRHRVVAVVRDLVAGRRMFAGLGVTCIPAPPRSNQPRKFDVPRTFAHLLHDSGFNNPDQLRSRAEDWRGLFHRERPNLIVFDHSPTALLAARGIDARRALIGTGFFCPLDQYPLPDLRPWLPWDAVRFQRDEDFVLANANHVLRTWGQPAMERITRLYHEVDENFLVTLPELDHYPAREGAKYWGVWPYIRGKKPVWPKGHGPRIFAYLKPFAALAALVAHLASLGCPTILYGPSLDERLPQGAPSANLRLEISPVDLAEVGRSCDLAILNGNHGSTVAMLLAGKPTLQIPLFLEQGLFSMAVERLGVGVTALATQPEDVVMKLSGLRSSVSNVEAARRFATRYANFDPQRQMSIVVRRAEELLGG
jgi:hypothetical protein